MPVVLTEDVLCAKPPAAQHIYGPCQSRERNHDRHGYDPHDETTVSVTNVTLYCRHRDSPSLAIPCQRVLKEAEDLVTDQCIQARAVQCHVLQKELQTGGFTSGRQLCAMFVEVQTKRILHTQHHVKLVNSTV